MKKKTLLIILLCIFIPVALAAPDYGDGEGDSGYTDLDIITGNTNWPVNVYGKNAKGIRISFVNSDGEHLGSKNYMPDGSNDPLTTSGHNMVYVTEKLYSKVSYFAEDQDVKWESSKKRLDSVVNSLSNLNEIINAPINVNGYTYSYNLPIASAISSNSYTALIDKLGDKINGVSDEISNGIRKVLFERLFDELDISGDVDDYKIDSDKENVYDLFLVLEPITFVQIDGKYYVGTDYELAIEAATKRGASDNCKTSINGGLCDLNGPLRRILPCTSYLTGSIDEQTSDIEEFKDKFTSTSYFNGAIKIVYNYADAICKTADDRMDAKYVKDNSGVALGIVWMSSGLTTTIIEDDDPEPEPEPEPEGYNCSPNLNYGTCINGDDVSYSDSIFGSGLTSDEYWNKCIFNDEGYYDSYFSDIHKWSNKDKTLSYYDSNLGSKYCEVYCIEEVTANFTSPNLTVEAGSRFTLGTSTVTGSRTCRTKSINWDQFKNDLAAANNDIIEAYENWQLLEKVKIAINNASVTVNSSGCDLKYNDGGIPGCMSAHIEKKSEVIEKPQCEPGDRPNLDGVCFEIKITEEYVCDDGQFNFEKYDLYSAGNVSFNVNGRPSQSYNIEPWCSNKSTPNVDNELKKAKEDYENAVNSANAIINAMKSCYNWNADDIYMANPNATLKYSDGNSYNLSTNLIGTTTYSDVISNFVFNSNQITIGINDCSGNSCSISIVNIPQYSKVEKTRRAETTFELDKNVYRYVLKFNHLSVHSIEGNADNYIDIGYGNLPVSFSAPAGIYGGNDKNNSGQFDIIYSNLGHINSNSSQTDVDKIMKNASTSDDKYGEWICQYEVITNLLPDPDGDNSGDINLIYRPIDLSNPFPDIDNSGRNTGDNWCDEEDCSLSNMNVWEYILNNRGVPSDEVYDLEPMYSFTLTPSIIREIRNYNKENTYTSYTGKLNSNSYDYECNNGTGKACVSGYLSYLITNAGNDGTCMDNKYRNPENPEDFYSCQ